MLVLQDMIAFLGEERAHDHLNLKAAGVSRTYRSLSVDMRVCVRLIRANDDYARPTVIQRLDVAKHTPTAVTMETELFVAAPSSQGAVEFTSNLLEDDASDDTTTA